MRANEVMAPVAKCTLLSNQDEPIPDATSVDERWSNYVNRYVRSDSPDATVTRRLDVPVFLKRCAPMGSQRLDLLDIAKPMGWVMR
jgi:hypothetical protein